MTGRIITVGVTGTKDTTGFGCRVITAIAGAVGSLAIMSGAADSTPDMVGRITVIIAFGYTIAIGGICQTE